MDWNARSDADHSGRTTARLTRRQMLRGAAGLALGVGATGLLAACGQQPAPAAPAGQQAAPAAVATGIVPKDISGAATAPTAAPAAPAAAPAATTAPAVGAAPAAPTAAPAAPAPTAAAKTGGMLIGAQEVDPVQLDPYASSNFSALQAYEH